MKILTAIPSTFPLRSVLFVVALFFSLSTQAQNVNYKLQMACAEGRYQEAKSLIAAGADVNHENYDGVTALMYAAQNGHLEVVRLLVESGAEVNKSPWGGITALIGAARAGHLSVVEFLVESGADIQAVDWDKRDALHYAVGYHDYPMCQLLLEKDIQPKRDIDGNTPMIVAAYSGDTSITNLLLTYEHEINVADEEGYTPLMVAAFYGHQAMVEWLIEHGAKLKIENHKSLTTLAIASQNGHTAVVKYLLEKGADPNHRITRTLRPLRPYTLAEINQHDSTTKVLKDYGAKGSLFPYFHILSFSLVNNFCVSGKGDYMIGLETGLYDSKYHFLLNGGIIARPFQKWTLHEVAPNYYYQLRESRSAIYLSLEKQFPLMRKPDLQQKGLLLGIKETYTWGDYEASKRDVKNRYITAPLAGLFWQSRYLAAQLKYEYCQFHSSYSPHRFSFNFAIHIPVNNVSAEKNFYWL